ncbi:hypothetical protein ADN00_01600 [Ornatilinea apprima]|uniref:Uncharacterized protein n=1 Tax=Ornatilinea apprima TaxID=1134406 RepID=A0A0P6XK61_9CHLR|nr:hypothetical protein ADN00_01600 [Ornatilinea apprima]
MWITARSTHQHPISGGKPKVTFSILRNLSGAFVHNRLWITGKRFHIFFLGQEQLGEQIQILGVVNLYPYIWGV